MKGKVAVPILCLVALALVVCPVALAKGGSCPQQSRQLFIGKLVAMNGSHIKGCVFVNYEKGYLKVGIDACGAERKIHAQAIVGLANGGKAVAPPKSADTNHDGLISAAEAAPYWGMPLLNLTPYPCPNRHGEIDTRVRFGPPSLVALAPATVNLSNRVVVIYGVTACTTYTPPFYAPDLPAAYALLKAVTIKPPWHHWH